VNVSGFLTPASGAVTSRVGFLNADGDRGTGDTLRLVSGGRSTLLGEAGAAPLNPTNDISHSTISRFAANVTARLPACRNTLGFDAATVVGWLVGHGIARERLESWGCGELHPTESNRTPRGRRSNRRVEFHIMAGVTPSEQLRRLVGCVETP